jgi:hypothetical protein
MCPPGKSHTSQMPIYRSENPGVAGSTPALSTGLKTKDLRRFCDPEKILAEKYVTTFLQQKWHLSVPEVGCAWRVVSSADSRHFSVVYRPSGVPSWGPRFCSGRIIGFHLSVVKGGGDLSLAEGSTQHHRGVLGGIYTSRPIVGVKLESSLGKIRQRPKTNWPVFPRCWILRVCALCWRT